MKEIPLTQGRVALVDDADYDAVITAGKWHSRARPEGNAYAARVLRTGERATGVYLHTFLTGWPLVDHVNGNGLDNRRENLRPATPSQNQANRPVRRDSSSGLKGVYAYPERGRWRARITAGRRVRSLGYFATPEAAARAYDAAAIELFGAYARLNFPKEHSA